MGTGIVSIGLALDQQPMLSRILLAIALVLWLGLLGLLVRRALRQRRSWLEEARTPGALVAVAGTAVLGDRLTLLGEPWAGYLLLAFAFCLWLALLPRVLRHWTTPTVGVSFMLTVAIESLAVLAALPRRWSTVFPLGMYAVCSIATGSISGIGGISSFGRAWIWVAFAVWVLVFAATLSRASGSSWQTRLANRVSPSRMLTNEVSRARAPGGPEARDA
jgi:tellurite resistance protein TehA-like permease